MKLRLLCRIQGPPQENVRKLEQPSSSEKVTYSGKKGGLNPQSGDSVRMRLEQELQSKARLMAILSLLAVAIFSLNIFLSGIIP